MGGEGEKEREKKKKGAGERKYRKRRSYESWSDGESLFVQEIAVIYKTRQTFHWKR